MFHLVPLHFPREIGVMTGLVGAAAGLGGFVLPNVLGAFSQMTGSFSERFILFAIAAFVCAGALTIISSTWERRFVGPGGIAPDSTPKFNVGSRPWSGPLEEATTVN